MKFLLIHYFDESDLDFDTFPETTRPATTSPEATAPADAHPDLRELNAWVDEMESTGVKLHGGRLRPAAEALTLRIRGGERLLTDGPFAETKEQIAGFDVLECDSLEHALESAWRHPTARSGTFELRQICE